MGYTITKPEYFSLSQIADSGQCFRFKEIERGLYRTIHKGNYLELEESKDKLNLSCTKDEWDTIWVNYFDLDTDYSKYENIIMNLGNKYNYIKEAFKFSKGIRILKQDSFEMLISYIISQRNRITKISSAVEKISKTFGKELIDKNTGKKYYSFPTVNELSIDIDDYADIRLGYRDSYVVDAVKCVRIKGIEYFNTFEKAKTLNGVGDKVANCYLLFGRHDISRFPIDVWIQRILDREFDGYLELEHFKEFAGVVQQCMFYYERTHNIH